MNATKNPTIVYLRVSTAEQDTDSQEHQVLEYCRIRGWPPPLIFRDAASGVATSRPGLEQMLAQVRGGGVHQVVTYKLDRLGRSLTHLAIIVGELQLRNVALICTSQGIDTSKQNPVGQLQLGVLMAVAEFERALIKERTLAGLEVARKRGKRLGRPPLDPKIVSSILETAARLGHHVRAVARELHASPSSVCRVCARLSRGLRTTSQIDEPEPGKAVTFRRIRQCANHVFRKRQAPPTVALNPKITIRKGDIAGSARGHAGGGFGPAFRFGGVVQAVGRQTPQSGQL